VAAQLLVRSTGGETPNLYTNWRDPRKPDLTIVEHPPTVHRQATYRRPWSRRYRPQAWLTPLKGEGPFNRFRTHRRTFAKKIPQADLEALLADKEQTDRRLTYHVVAGRFKWPLTVVSMTKCRTGPGQLTERLTPLTV